MQLAFDSADRLVELVEARRGPVPAEDAARALFALRSLPAGLARELLREVVDGDARLRWRGAAVALADPPGADAAVELARYVVVDLETTGLSPGRSRICEIGAVRVERLELGDRFQTLVNPGAPLPAAVATLTGIDPVAVRRAPSAAEAVRRFLAFAGDAVLVAHNARFDTAFLDREVERLTGRRLAAPVVDTVALARRLLRGRETRAGLAALAHFFGTATAPCHRALPDAEATAEILVRLIGLAQERGARTVADLVELSAPRARAAHGKRALVAGAPQRPGVYLFRDAAGRVLYVGKARDLRARLRSYFGSERQRPSVEAALAVLARVEWRVLGSELEAALEELRLIRELAPPANARGKRAGVYLAQRGGRWVVTETPTRAGTALGPVRSRRRAREAACALDGYDEPDAAVAALRERLRALARDLRFEDAARVRDRLEALEAVVADVEEAERLRRLRACVLAPAADERFERAFLVDGGRLVARTLPRGAPRLELAAALAELARAPEADLDELRVVASFLRRPPPELRTAELAGPLAA